MTISEVAPNTGVITEGVKALAGGVADAATNSWNMIDDAATWLDNNVMNLRVADKGFGTVAPHSDLQPGLQMHTPEMLENHTTAGKIVRTLTQVAVPFAGAMRALKGVQMVNAAVKGAAVGAAVDFSVLDPNEKHVSDVIREVAGTDSVFDNSVTQYLSSAPDDTHMESRFKNTVEGLGAGMVAEGLFKSIKAVKTHFWDKGMNPAAAVEQGAKDFKTDALHEAAHSEPSVLDRINAEHGIDPVGQATAKREKTGDVFHTFYNNPDNAAKLDAWQAAAADAKLATGDSSVVKKSYSGEPPIIGKPDDPMVKDFGNSFSDAMGVTSDATRRAAVENTPAFARTSEQIHAINSYSKLQDATIAAMREAVASVKGVGSGAVFTASERKAIRIMNELDLKVVGTPSKSVFSDAERASIHTEADATAKQITERQKNIEQIAPILERLSAKGVKDGAAAGLTATGKVNSDGTFNFVKDASGHIEPSSLIIAGTHASKQGIVTGAVAGAATLSGAAQADDGNVFPLLPPHLKVNFLRRQLV